MSNPIQELAERLLQNSHEAGEIERNVADKFSKRLPISRNPNRHLEDSLTFGQRLADKIAIFGGSWTFMILFGSVLVAWVVLNSFILVRWGKPFDPFPYIFLNLVLSMLASIQAPVIMMSQNRQAAKDRIDAEHDYEVNLKAELEIMALHEKLDALREVQWAELVAMQQEQIRLLTQVLERRG